MQPTLRFIARALVPTLLAGGVIAAAAPAYAASPATFTLTPLLLADGSSEPEIAVGADGTTAMVSLQWLFDPTSFGTVFWTGVFGVPPTLQGIVDNTLQHPGKAVFGAGDADVDFGSTGKVHITTLIILAKPIKGAQIGVSAISCPKPLAGSVQLDGCTSQIIDTTESDRPWISSDGAHVYISYHDSGNASLIHVQRSDDDGATWRRAGNPIVAQGGVTGDATFNNIQGNLVADPFSHNVYDVYAAGETGELKARTFTPNHIIVSRSTDLGKTWTANIAFTAPPGTSLGNIFPALAVDPVNGSLYAVWSDGHSVALASSSDQGATWSAPMTLSSAPANTAVLPWVAAYNGTVDVVYYGTSAASDLDPGADWQVYFAQLAGGSFAQTQVNAAPNHHGVICTGGTGCTAGTRNLLDLFQIAIDPVVGKAAIIYTDDTLSTSSAPGNFACLPNQAPPCPLPQAVLAEQN
jgi:BNR repeat protein